jgi:glycosyltransferase involved in cell wall biosynthesis
MSLKISVITATYNSASCVGEAVHSILAQSYKNFELLIVDGASKDNTVDLIQTIIENSPEKAKVKIVSEPDKGIYDALNKGIARASGEVIAFLHADDVYASEDILQKVAEEFMKGNLDAVYGDLEYVAKEDLNKTIRYWKSGSYNVSKLKNGWMPPHPSFFVKKAVYEKYGDFDTQFRIAADYDFMMRVLFKGKISAAYIPIVFVKMRVGGASNKSIKNIIRKSREDLKAMKKNNMGGILTLLIKNLRKLPQFFKRS